MGLNTPQTYSYIQTINIEYYVEIIHRDCDNQITPHEVEDYIGLQSIQSYYIVLLRCNSVRLVTHILHTQHTNTLGDHTEISGEFITPNLIS